MIGDRANTAFVDRAAGFMAFALPMLLSVISAAKEPYWLDAPELTAAAQTMGIPHPPGHPLYVMLTKPFTLFPLGGLGFRVSLASAFYGGCASFLLFLVCRALVRTSARGLPGWMGALTALAASVTASVAPGWWIQSVRQEVYAVQIAVVLAALYPFLRFSLDPRRANEHLLYAAAFFAGLGLSNHHFIMFSAMPAAIPQLVAVARYRGGVGALQLSAKLALTAAAGLLPYLFLPMRAASGAPVSLGGVHSLRDFFWVVSAKAYQKSMVQAHIEGLDERAVGGMFSMMGQLGPVMAVAAVLGFYLLLRTRRTRMAGILLSLVTIVTWLLRATMGFDPFNPDYYGYMMPVIAALAAGIAVFGAVTLDVIRAQTRRGPALSLLLFALLLLVPLHRARAVQGEVDLSAFRSTRLFKNFCFDRVPPGALVLVNDYNLFFALWSDRFVDGSRPDVTVINPSLLTYPGYLTATLRENHDLAALARALLVHRRLTESAVAELSLSRPLRIQPDHSLDDAVVRYMTPEGPLYTALPEPLTQTDVVEASPEHHAHWKRFYQVLGDHWREPETLRVLAWAHYQDALFMARRGDRAGASQAVAMGLALNPRIPELLRLAAALSVDEEGPMVIAPFLPGAGRPAARADGAVAQ